MGRSGLHHPHASQFGAASAPGIGAQAGCLVGAEGAGPFSDACPRCAPTEWSSGRAIDAVDRHCRNSSLPRSWPRRKFVHGAVGEGRIECGGGHIEGRVSAERRITCAASVDEQRAAAPDDGPKQGCIAQVGEARGDKMRNGWMGSAVLFGRSSCDGGGHRSGDRQERRQRQRQRQRPRRCGQARKGSPRMSRRPRADACQRAHSPARRGQQRRLERDEITRRQVVSVGHDNGGGGTPGCRQLVNLDGQGAALPGLIDNHADARVVPVFGLRPGWHTPARDRGDGSPTSARPTGNGLRAHQAGAFITTIGGFNTVQFAESGRCPTLAELDAIAPSNPVYLQVSFTGPAATNTLGRAFFQSRGIAVSGRRRDRRERADRGRSERAALGPDLRRQEARHARRAGLLGRARRDDELRHGRLPDPRLAGPRGRVHLRRRGELGSVHRVRPAARSCTATG